MIAYSRFPAPIVCHWSHAANRRSIGPRARVLWGDGRGEGMSTAE
jgi:hypothetical protein